MSVPAGEDPAGRLDRAPREVRARARQLERAWDRLVARGRTPRDADMARSLRMGRAEFRALRAELERWEVAPGRRWRPDAGRGV